MKKIILIFLAIVMISIAIICINYSLNKIQYETIVKENAEFEQYKNKEIYGIDLGTIINKAVDKNTKNEIEKDKKRKIYTK